MSGASTAGAITDEQKLLVECLEELEYYWMKIDGEWGSADGDLEGAIARGEETLIPRVRAAIAKATGAKP